MRARGQGTVQVRARARALHSRCSYCSAERGGAAYRGGAMHTVGSAQHKDALSAAPMVHTYKSQQDADKKDALSVEVHTHDTSDINEND